ncbi:MAG: class I SAM-dependent methyltransferase [bacterium]
MRQTSSVHPAQTGWDEYYQARELKAVLWYTEQMDQDFAALFAKYGKSAKTILDLGTGPGTTAIELARLGYRVTASDISPTIIAVARQRAGALADLIDWRVDDIIRTSLSGPFEIIHDRGLFHVLKEKLRLIYVEQIRRLLNPNGFLFLKTFSKQEPGDWGPYRFDIDELRGYFSKYFDLLEWQDTEIPSTTEKDPKALLAVFQLRTG